jgi:hypothetical protein
MQLLAAAGAAAGQAPLDRLPRATLDVLPPSARVDGAPGRMTIRATPCRSLPSADVRRRIVEVAVQEWGFFGFGVLDRTAVEDEDEDDGVGPRRRRRLPPELAARVAASIAGYWAVTPSGGWIVEQQNDSWNGEDGVAARWRYPWSAAFVSWVMCESGLAGADQFQRGVAHHVYIDQAIRARDREAPRSAYVAYELGETAVAPGDLLCSARRPAYRSLAERRRQMGTGARTHCDIVVKVDRTSGRVFAIGGNVRGAVSLKILPSIPVNVSSRRSAEPPGARPLFAHLKLRGGPVDAAIFDASPTLSAIGCALPTIVLTRRLELCDVPLD